MWVEELAIKVLLGKEVQGEGHGVDIYGTETERSTARHNGLSLFDAEHKPVV